MSALENTKQWASEQVNEFVHSEDFISWAQDQAGPTIKDNLEAFLKQPEIQDKIHEYQQDPQKLEQDFLEYTGWLTKVDQLLTVLDIALIIPIVISGLSSFGLGAAAGVGLRAIVQQALKQGVKSVAKTIVTRALAAVASGVLKKYAVLGTTRFSAGIIREITGRVVIHTALSTMLGGMQAGSAAALIAGKDTILRYGVELGMPMSIVDKVTKPDIDANTFKTIIGSYLEGLSTYIINLVTTKTGLTNLTIGGLARAVGAHKIVKYRRFSESYHQAHAAAQAGSLTLTSYSKEYGLREKLQQAKQELDSKNKPKDKEDQSLDIATAVQQSALPKMLHYSYRKMLEQATLQKQPKEAKTIVEDELRSANYRIAEVAELLKEIGTLEVIDLHSKQLTQINNETLLDELLEDVTNLKGTNSRVLIETLGRGSLTKLVADLRETKNRELQGLLDVLALGDENLSTLQQTLADRYNINNFKKALMEQTQAALLA